MSRPIRYQPEEWSVWFVTGRCIHSRYLLRPSPRTNAIVIGALARALKRYEVKLFGVCFMSNHYHLLLSSKNAGALAGFMQYIAVTSPAKSDRYTGGEKSSGHGAIEPRPSSTRPPSRTA